MTIHSKDILPSRAGEVGARPISGATGGFEAVRIPAIRVDAFCESPDFSSELARALGDRRMSRATSEQRPGGLAAAIAHYRKSGSPNLIILETSTTGGELLSQLEELATVCDSATKLILIGDSNDVNLYRSLVRQGITEYLCRPTDSAMILTAIGDAFSTPEAAKVGRIYAFFGARGGTGSSMLAHNLAWTLGEGSGGKVLLVDMDLPFGTAALDFDLRPEKTIFDAARDPKRLDDQLLETLVTPCGERLGILSAPASLDLRDVADGQGFDAILDTARRAASHIAIDLPHLWSEWTKRMLVDADEVVITATPDLASLRNTQSLIDMLRKARPHDAEPKILLNQVGVPKRPEIKSSDFFEVLQVAPFTTIPFDPKVFGAASNTGRAVEKVPGGSRYTSVFRTLSEALAGCPLAKPRRTGKLRGLLRRRAG